MCVPCVSDACGGQNSSTDPVELELEIVVSREVCACLRPGPEEETDITFYTQVKCAAQEQDAAPGKALQL